MKSATLVRVAGIGVLMLQLGCKICTPGKRHECLYLKGQCKTAEQTCNSAGTQWEPCQCIEPLEEATSSPPDRSE
jgi:hypothetical protein